jgi:hypothetical protein
MQTAKILTDAAEIAAAAWDAPTARERYLIVPCRECAGTGTQRVYRSGRLHDYDVVACPHCDEGAIGVIENPAYRG